MGSDRFLRHSMIDWFSQEKVRESRVVVVGAGATGNEVMKNLCLLGIGHIHIIDFDLIEEHNLTRNVLYTEKDIGSSKAEVAARACREIDPGIEITFSAANFWKTLSIENLRSYDALFCCVDNFEARIRLNEMCMWARVDLYNLAIDSRFAAIERYPFSGSEPCACYQCTLPESVYARIRERYSCGWLRKRAYQEKKIPTTIITSSIAGAQACSLFLQKEHPASPPGAVRSYIDTIGLNSTVTVIEKNEFCYCSSIAKDHHHFKVRNGLNESLPGHNAIDGETMVYMSDKIILDVTCAQCGTRRTINDLAENYDDSLSICGQCHTPSNEVKIKDLMSLEELGRLFGISVVPVKYMYFHREGSQFLFELEGYDG